MIKTGTGCGVPPFGWYPMGREMLPECVLGLYYYRFFGSYCDFSVPGRISVLSLVTLGTC